MNNEERREYPRINVNRLPEQLQELLILHPAKINLVVKTYDASIGGLAFCSREQTALFHEGEKLELSSIDGTFSLQGEVKYSFMAGDGTSLFKTGVEFSDKKNLNNYLKIIIDNILK
ncbi:MAG: hypothetical protein A2096_07515 [Spirochaetes bacterium GWF1_41_5]|nr:MAG: hypothetical protein A2096_07515 [Spirochaetes bacterium GWF1_41_5]HBE01931.1 hypothetical protein [Spirochaetia bacterium]